MSKIVAKLIENYSWIDEISSINTVIFTLLFIVIIIGVLRLKKKDVDHYKNIPLNEDENNH